MSAANPPVSPTSDDLSTRLAASERRRAEAERRATYYFHLAEGFARQLGVNLDCSPRREAVPAPEPARMLAVTDEACRHCGTEGYGSDHASDCPNNPVPGHGTGTVADYIVETVTKGFRADVKRIMAQAPTEGALTYQQQLEIMADLNGWKARAEKAEAALSRTSPPETVGGGDTIDRGLGPQVRDFGETTSALEVMADHFGLRKRPRAEAALSSAPPAEETWQAIDGFKLVPIVATRAMIDAVSQNTSDYVLEPYLAQDIWDDMLAAAPLPPGPAGEAK